jgi:type IV pilus assembly protein PilC
VEQKIVSEKKVAATRKLSRMKPKELLNFTYHLVTLLDAGIPLAAALRDLARDESKENLQKIIDAVRYHVESGSSFKDALTNQPRSFPKLYTAIAGAGENTGKLSFCLNDLAILLDWQMELGAKVKEAATYPIILFCVMMGVVALLVLKMIPTFEPIFKEMGTGLPAPTQIVLDISRFARQAWLIILGIIILLAIGYKLWTSTPKGRYKADSLKLKLPLLGDLLRKITLSRFCHTLALSLRSGTNILQALDLAADVVGNVRIRQSVLNARDSVNVGEKLGASFQISREFPPMVIRMIKVGEQSGNLSQSLDRVNYFYDREVPATIKKMFALFEPMMIVFMGVVVGGIAIAMFLPMFKMAEVIGG